jgi:secondary thiamine-phosphate synthase enzyme
LTNKINTRHLTLQTKGFTDIIDITPRIQDFLSETGIREGILAVFVQGSTGAVTTIEYEPNLVKDFKQVIERIAPSNISYEHGKTWGDDNGHSHLRASVVGCSESIAIHAGRLMLGTWQQVVVVDFDTRPRKRKVYLTACGD